MHMSDALVSPPVFIAAGAASLALLGVAIRRVGQEEASVPDTPDASDTEGVGARRLPLMGVLGAFVFAAQMINFTIPGTGSSGHLVGGILLAAILGPWAAFLSLTSVVVLQCLVFADGGFMALGCNILNMAALSALVAYPLLFRPIARRHPTPGGLLAASLIASVVGLELGALAVTVETVASGVTALPADRFLLFMLPIHLPIGIGEGLATAGVLSVVQRYRPELLADLYTDRQQPVLPAISRTARQRRRRTFAALALAALLLGGTFSWIASSRPDGLEWSIRQTAGPDGLEPAPSDLHRTSAALQERTALMPDYDTSLAGLIGCGALLLVAAGTSRLFRPGRKQR